MTDVNVILKRFDAPDESREVERGRFEIIRVGKLTVGRVTYQPGWKWSLHAGPSVGANRCALAHIGFVVSGAATAAFDDGRVIELCEGTWFSIPAVPHDSWVIGDRPYTALHFLDVDLYANNSRSRIFRASV